MSNPLRVNVYDVADDGRETFARGPVLLSDCFNTEWDREDYIRADNDLRKSGRFWGGGGAAPVFLLMAVRS